jgi:mannose-6-phosphate isomerase
MSLMHTFMAVITGFSFLHGPCFNICALYADCLECMACSDNVVRAGLTPKFKDIETLCSMLHYEPGTVDRFRMNWQPVDSYCEECRPPVPDFAMARVRLPTSVKDYQLPCRTSASILVILQGQVQIVSVGEFNFGQILFLKANQQITLTAQSTDDVIIYQSFSNV